MDGCSIAYREAGQGAGLVLLHGFLSDSRCWRSQLSGLSDGFRVVAWDAPGAGSSSDPPDTFTTMSYARCLAGFLDTIGIARAHVVGLSWGGILAQVLSLDPERLRCLILARHHAGWKGSLPEAVWRRAIGFLPPRCGGAARRLGRQAPARHVHRRCLPSRARRAVRDCLRVPPDWLPPDVDVIRRDGHKRFVADH